MKLIDEIMQIKTVKFKVTEREYLGFDKGTDFVPISLRQRDQLVEIVKCQSCIRCPDHEEYP